MSDSDEELIFNDVKRKTILEKEEEEPEEEEKQEEEKQEEESEEKQLEQELEQEEVTLQLGDIIVIQSPGDYILDKKIFYVDYIDKQKIKIINVDDFSTNSILINSDGTISDNNIKSIAIISSNPNKGYARQNNLLPNTWVDILFGGDIPAIITGQITNLEDDMIEIKTIDKDVLYINFNYQGIPENLPPVSFEIREKPTSIKGTTEKETTEKGETIREPKEDIKSQRNKLKGDNIILNDNDFVIGELVQIEEIINVDDTMRRYNIEEQTNDFFENLVSTIPNNKRNSTIINEFNIIVKRFVELRQMSSIFDKYGNVEGPIIHSASDIPLANYLSEFHNKLYWIKYGVVNNREIYDGNDNSSIVRDVSSIANIFKQYSKANGGIDQNNYYKLFNTLNPYTTPFNPINTNEHPNVFSKPEGLIISRPITDEVYAIDNTMSNVTSQIYRRNKETSKQYVMQQYNTGLDWFVISALSKSGRMVGKREKMTPNEIINVNSIFTLPEPVVRFSQINLPSSNLLTKSNLNHLFVNYFQLLNKTSPTKNIILNDLENVPDSGDYLSNEIKKFTLNLTNFAENDKTTDMTIFHQFIKLIVPSTSILFNLINKYIRGTLSPQNAILYLEPFMIYSNDLTFTQYKNISEFVKNKIREYNDTFGKYEEIFNMIKNKNSNANIFTSNLYNLLNDLKPENIKPTKNKEQSVWVEFMSTKYNKPYWRNSITQESVWVKPDELEEKDEEPEIQIGFFNEDMKSKIIEMYQLSDTNMSSSEFITKIISHDHGNLFNSLIAYTNLKLMFSNKLNKLFEEEKELLKQIIETDRAKNSCKTYVIAKKYYSYQKLIADNDIDIYFDKEYDSTNYDIISEKFQTEKNSMSSEEFNEFLIRQLKKIYKLTDENGSYLAETLTNGLKKVLNGHYALLSIPKDEIQTIAYYERQDDMWIEATDDLNLSSFVKDDDVLCNINYDCLYDTAETVEGKCLSNDVNIDNAIERQFKGILDQFDKNYEFSMDDLTVLIKNKIIFNENKFNVLTGYYKNEFLKYNNNAYKLGQSLNKNDIITVVSPYAKLRDMILGQNDYAKKQQNIIMFIDKYCRKGISSTINSVTNENESDWWFYCRDTNMPLIPYFRYELAKIFLENPQEYENVLNKLIKEIGKQSDSGDSWVDKHSGEVICKIDFDFSEGFKDGFVNKSREIIETSTDEIVAENLTNKQLALSFKADENTIYLNDIIVVLEGALGVQLKEHKEFILKIGTSLLRFKSSDNAGILLTRKEYTEKMSKKTDKKIPSYELYYSMKVMYLALGLFAIGLQITIPSIKTRKIAPRCTKSFQGYPLGDSTDISFVKYIVCAIKQNRSDTVPWIAIEKNDDKMVPLVISNLDEYLLPNIEIRQKIIKKIEYLNSIQSKDIPDEYSVIKWSNFLPPLRKFHIKSENKRPVDDNFLENLKKNILNSDSKQQVQINVIHSKIIYQSLAIQEEIQKIIDEKELIMKSSSTYHMINSCCNNVTDNITSLQYFINDSPLIENYNNYVQKMSDYLAYINNLSKSAIYASDVNTKSVFPEIPNIINEENIYRAFITYCKFNTLGGLSKDLLDICIEKPNYTGKGRSIQEQIFQLKKIGREYTADDFLKLYKVVSRNNIIYVNINKRESTISELSKFLNSLKSKKMLYVLSEKIVKEYSLLADPANFYQLYENDTNEMKNIKNQLELENDKLSLEIIKYIESNKGTNSKKTFNSIKYFIQNLRFSKWEFNASSKNTKSNVNNISNDKLYNYNKYMSNFIELFSNTFPEAIVNKKKYTLISHKYWKLSQYHTEMIKTSVEKYYSHLNKFYNNLPLESFLSSISKICKNIVKLSKLTPSMTNIINNGVFKHSFDEEMSSFLYEYYLLCIFKSYILLSESEIPYVDKSGDEQMSDVLTNKKNVSELFVVYLGLMIDSKHEVNISYDIVFDNVFKNVEFEKNLVTDRLANMTQEERDVDTTLKGLKLGMYGIGQSKALRFYDEDQFEEDKKRNEKISMLEKKSKKPLADDVDFEDDQYNSQVDADEATELMMNDNEDYQDGNPYGDEPDGDEY
jgi:hypothetical protein